MLSLRKDVENREFSPVNQLTEMPSEELTPGAPCFPGLDFGDA